MKIVTVVGTRPEIIRLSALVPKLDNLADHVFVHTGQNDDPNLSDVFFRDLDLRTPDHFLNVNTSSMGSVMGETIIKIEQVLLQEAPDAVMILGDTNSAIAAIVAERMHIPVFHMEAGNRSFDANVPEELNRRMVDHVASFNLPYNSFSRDNLINEGLHPRTIQKTGSPISEIFEIQREKIYKSQILEELKLDEGNYFLVSIHRQENVDHEDSLNSIIDSLSALKARFDRRILISTHPRTKKRLDELHGAPLDQFEFHAPFGYLDYCRLQLGAFCVISDSGTISEESAIMGFSAVCIRNSIERPEALETGSMLLSGLSSESVIRCVEHAVQGSQRSLPEGYEIMDFSERVVRFVMSALPQYRNWYGLK